MKNNNVLITGSSKGLGKELAHVFASNGHDIILHGRDKENLKQIKQNILKKNKKIKCYVFEGDLRLQKSLGNLYEFAKAKQTTILINNAGIGSQMNLENMEDNEIEDILTTNLNVPIKLTKKFYKLFLELGKGTIININSILGLEIGEYKSIYCASKWGLKGFTDAFRLEAQKNNVRIIGIYPTRVKTKPEYNYGMEPSTVARKIYDLYANTNLNELILDNRPKKR